MIPSNYGSFISIYFENDTKVAATKLYFLPKFFFIIFVTKKLKFVLIIECNTIGTNCGPIFCYNFLNKFKNQI